MDDQANQAKQLLFFLYSVLWYSDPLLHMEKFVSILYLFTQWHWHAWLIELTQVQKAIYILDNQISF